MKRIPQRLTISARTVTDVPKSDTDRLRQAVREQVIKPMKKRAAAQQHLIAKVRSRTVS